MKKFFAAFAVLMVMLATPAFADGTAVQLWRCEMDDDATEEQVVAAAQKWLAAAKAIDGGKNLEAYLYFPVAVSNTGETDLLFVVHAPNFKEWGVFWDAYQDSDVGDLDAANRELITPTDSALWDTTNLEAAGGPADFGKATQMWRCEIDDDATEEQVIEAGQKWLAAARKMNGGKNLDANIFFPVSVSNNGQTDAVFVVSAPSFSEWGQFWDGYKNSPAAKLDFQHRELITPIDSGLWEAVKIK